MTDHDTDARFWNRAARKYAAAPIKDMAGYERTLAETLLHLKPADTVLEVGCGTGTTALRVAPHVGHITGTDIAGEMVAIAREKAAAQTISNAAFTVGTPDAMPWPDDSFDAVLSYNVLHLVEARASALREIHRVLKPDGMFISKTTCLSEMNRLLRPAVSVMRAIGKAPHVDFFTAHELERDVAASGFEIVERARHGTTRKDARIYIVARKP